ncbi:hypothetical protein N7539_000974 [Penicillium diatomitis]|uniref:Nucleoporin Nup159/Nup146 N-terminal domain-containing protein n=1 Tax=Penicillium diatomitis TaxID=2819901 RepID=A0A9W9XMQ8_9EURO|nr:uncharacterized protein N7539_000974 [Penicillium diatomitis]KAJ5495858.1 hypothetical protein N7539_000974 [Penicillium diatomitis]
MAFSFGSSSGPAGASAPTELAEIFTDEFGFKGVSGDISIRFLPSPWPQDALPAPTTSLLTVAQNKGIVVGAGPDCLVVATTQSVRTAIETSSQEESNKTKPFQPQSTIPLPARPTHVAFTASDDALILATENASQITVFQTDTLLQGNVQPALSVQTNGATIRCLAPNPDPSSTLVALVTVNGELLIADLKAGNLVTGANGPALRNGVSCVAWSNKGKQLVAGMADGSAEQMTPDGTQKAQIPRPSDLEGECHVSSISWLENDIFFSIYTPNAPEDDMGIPASSYYMITRQKQAPFLLQKLPEICPTIGFMMKRAPAFQFIARLRDYKPHLKDVLIVASTASADVGMVVRSEKALDDNPAGQFAVANVNDDVKRASIPLTESGDDTSVIGLSCDLSSSDKVPSPLPGEEIIETSSPLPALFALNNEGNMCAWWFIYTDAIRQNIPYSGLVSGSAQIPAQAAPSSLQPATPAMTQQQQQQPAFGQSSFGSPSPLGASSFAKPTGSATFGTPSAMGATPFGKAAAPAFGSTSNLGSMASPGFGKPSLGPSSGTAFGQTSSPGHGVAFGKSGFGAPSTSSPFGQSTTPAKSLLNSAPGTSGGGFSSFSSGAGTGGGFAAFAAAKPAESPFAKTSGDNAFAKTSSPSPFASSNAFGETAFAKASSPSPFGAKPSGETAFPSAQSAAVKNPFGSNSGFGSGSGFVLGSSFKGDGTAASDSKEPEKSSSGAMSLSGFGKSISLSNDSTGPTESMDDSEDKTAPAAAKSQPTAFFSPPPPKPSSNWGASPFGAKALQTKPASSPLATQTGSGFSMFGSSSAAPSQSPPQTKPRITSPLSTQSDVTATPQKGQSILSPTSSSLEAPLPPDSTTKTSYAPGDTSASSNVSKSSAEDAPLPPDFVSIGKSSKEVEDAPLPPDFTAKPIKTESPPPGVPEDVPEEAPLPPDPTTFKRDSTLSEDLEAVPDETDLESQDGDESDFSDIGEDLNQDEADAGESFSGLSDKSSTGGLFSGFSKGAKKDQTKQAPRALFGEISKGPVLPPPGPAIRSGREPYRSPSPNRASSQKGNLLLKKSDAFKVGSALASKKAALAQSTYRKGPLRKVSDAAREERVRAQAAALQRAEEEVLALSDDDEDERLRADLARPVEPAATLDPFLPHQDYTGDTAKPGVPGMIERLYRDINSMVDTLGINARSMESFLLYQQPAQGSDHDTWVNILTSDNPSNILDEDLFLQDISIFEDVITSIGQNLDEQRLQGVEDKLNDCRALLTKDIVSLRAQFASIRKTLDALTDTGAILSAPLSAEQVTLQQDLRTTFTDLQGKLAELEQGVSMLRAKIADIPRRGGAGAASRKRPTVEAVSSTIATMMSMAESKSSDIDVLEAQLKKLGFDTSVSGSVSREGSPFATPRKAVGRFPATPGSRGSVDGSAYHTPESAARGLNFRASLNGSAKQSRLRSVDVAGPVGVREESSQWKAKNQRRRQLIGSLKDAMEKKEKQVRGVDDL